ncbi:MAG TPA: tyrosine-type recombinase/integrase, partial [Gemmataceae bacterium]|nr:tyrosine-type recombinase/integrase [Gemmataceae bacterium]
AGIPYAVEGPDGPRFADFHSLRHSYLTLGGRAGIDLRTLQELAGHSTPVLTARYSHRRLHDLAGAVEKLPNFLPADTTAGRLAATGTDGFIDAVQSLSKTRNDGPAPSAQPAQQQAHEKRTDTLEKQQIGPVGPVGKEREETRASHFSRLQEGDTMSLSTTAGVDIGCTLVAQTPCNQKHLTASGGTKAEVEEVTEKQRNPLNCQRVASPGISRHQTGELGFEGRQVAGHRQGVDSE